MTGRGWNVGGTVKNRKSRPIEDYLVVGSHISSFDLKKKLINEGLLEERCSLPYCPHPETTINGFTGEELPTPLTLDHINGINDDNRLENLRLICANCDRYNSTFCRGSKPAKKKVRYVVKTGQVLCECGGEKYYRSARCRKCSYKYRKKQPERIPWPSDDDLVSMVKSSSYMAAARQLGCSDNAVRKRMKKRGLL